MIDSNSLVQRLPSFYVVSHAKVTLAPTCFELRNLKIKIVLEFHEEAEMPKSMVIWHKRFSGLSLACGQISKYSIRIFFFEIH